MHERSKFAGGDQTYLRDEQYADGTRLARRASLHTKYRTGPTPWLDWVSAQFQLQVDVHVLEVGCGTGWVWSDSDVDVPSGVQLTLTDLSQGMVDEAVARAAATGRFASVTGQQADLQTLPLPSQTFHRVVADHMLYHLPDPERGVAQLARVVRPDGLVIAATNGRRHMRELWRIRAEVFGTPEQDQTVDVFGAERGFTILRDHFDDVRWLQHHDELRCTDPDDVLAYICSTPPAEDADDEQLAHLRRLVDQAFAEDGGAMTITKDTGCFVCRAPRSVR